MRAVFFCLGLSWFVKLNKLEERRWTFLRYYYTCDMDYPKWRVKHLKNQNAPEIPHVFLLGAGASKKAGVLLVDEMTELFQK